MVSEEQMESLRVLAKYLSAEKGSETPLDAALAELSDRRSAPEKLMKMLEHVGRYDLEKEYCGGTGSRYREPCLAEMILRLGGDYILWGDLMKCIKQLEGK